MEKNKAQVDCRPSSRPSSRLPLEDHARTSSFLSRALRAALACLSFSALSLKRWSAGQRGPRMSERVTV